ncbi:MAG: AAA family ATPase [Faecousia sp.]
MRMSVITISRQFGSGGRQIGAMLAKQLNVPFYDKALFAQAAERSGIHRDFFESAESRKDRLFANAFQPSPGAASMSLDDRIFLAQTQAIRELAEHGPCILVGRGANRILAERGDVLNVYIYAEEAKRLSRIVDIYGVPAEQAAKLLRETDKNRAAYLRDYTGQIFGKAENYHLCIDSGTIGIENSVKIIEAVYRTL